MTNLSLEQILKQYLDRLLKELKEKPAIKVMLLGHTDNIGSESYNQKLSQERAKTAAEYLIKNGINKSSNCYKRNG